MSIAIIIADPFNSLGWNEFLSGSKFSVLGGRFDRLIHSVFAFTPANVGLPIGLEYV